MQALCMAPVRCGNSLIRCGGLAACPTSEAGAAAPPFPLRLLGRCSAASPPAAARIDALLCIYPAATLQYEYVAMCSMAASDPVGAATSRPPVEFPATMRGSLQTQHTCFLPPPSPSPASDMLASALPTRLRPPAAPLRDCAFLRSRSCCDTDSEVSFPLLIFGLPCALCAALLYLGDARVLEV